MINRIQLIREAHAKAKVKALAEQGKDHHAVIDELLPVTKEDVLDEAKHLDALDHVEKVDFDNDENEVDMDTLSPEMRELYYA